MNIIPSWICVKRSKNLFVKIVHPGGHVEIHDRPILAADLLSRHPKCCVAHPDVFHHPYAVVAPSTTLALGCKYYVVPIRTVRRLQLKYSSSQRDHNRERKSCPEMEQSSCCMKNGSQREADYGGEKSEGLKNRWSAAQWQPCLESIIEE